MDYICLLNQIMENGKVIPSSHVFGGGEVRELNHVTLDVWKPLYHFKGVRELNYILNYWGNELAWYFSGDRSKGFIEGKAALWKEIANPDGTLNSNYGFLVFYNKTLHPSLSEKGQGVPYVFNGEQFPNTFTPFDWAVHCLKKDKNSRQAIMTYNTGGFNFEGNKDYICTQHQAFFIRQNCLNCYVALRSSDAVFGLTYNMPWWKIVAEQLRVTLLPTYPDLEMGDIKVTIYSAHIYKKHYELVRRMLEADTATHDVELVQPVPLGHDVQWYIENMAKYLLIK